MEHFVSNVTQTTPHPFYPLEANIVGYLANEYSVPQLLGTFAAGCVVILGLTLALVALIRLSSQQVLIERSWVNTLFLRRYHQHNTLRSLVLMLRCLGYFAYNHASMAGMGDIFGQLWKEYALSDSRYMTRDPFVICMETSTAIFWGPLAYCVALMITTQHPLRYPLQALVSLGQMYGDVLYYATSMFDHYVNGLTYFRPEAYYFWVYYFFMNFIWIIIPGSEWRTVFIFLLHVLSA
ncbi:MAG: hypothetical protein Q9191_005361 [Dirinaria sp. TL-2023a]